MLSRTKHGVWSEAAKRVLYERYLWKKDGRVVEDPDGMCWRVARAVASAEANWPASGHAVEEVAEEFYDLLVERRFMPNSPTLMNAGKENGQQLSACFVLPIEDSLDKIFETLKAAALVHQSGGGTGFSFSRLRPEGAIVRSTQGVASGPVSFMKVYDAATEHVKQGGSRRGANMGILRVDHPDILKFIDSKLNGGITNFNISVAATDRFMEALARDEEYDLISPQTGEVVGSLRAKEVFQRIVDAAWRTGDPGMVFIDRANRWTCNPVPELGPLESTNPCGEQFLYGWDACNLGSINLAQFVTKRNGRPEIDWDALGATVRTCVRFLDDVIEINPFPIQQITEMVRSNRRIGLGVMGWADLLFMLGIPYDSEEALALASRLMEFITRTGREASIDLARERGPFPNFYRSIYKDGPPIRNSTVTTIAPTGTISIIAGCSSGIEPVFALAYRHKSGDRTLEFFNPVFEEIGRQRGFLTEAVRQEVLARGTVRDVAGVPPDVQRIFVTAHEIHPDWHVRMQAAFQRHTDNAVSKTINLPNNATPDDIARAYLLAYELGCLGITVFRDGCKGEQVLNVGLKDTKPAASPKPVPAAIKPRPPVVHGYTRQIQAPEGKVNITINSDADGPLEVFVNVGRAGSDILALAEAVGRLISLTLRLPSPMSQTERLREVANQLRGIAGSRSVGFGAKQVRSLPDAVAQALDQHLGEDTAGTERGANGHYRGAESVAQLSMPLWTGNLCPNCGNNTLIYEEGCRKCHACAYTEC